MTAQPKDLSEIAFPPELPVSAHREAIISALAAHPVVIVCGDTGSGKTTQIPKMCLARDPRRRIAVTQPRRLAAVTMAERVADELGVPVGGLVGYRHRYGRESSTDTRVLFLTDGVLLAETRSDPLLAAYGTIIVDEAHERSLNIDFLLGILKRILAKRRDLKVIVSSATLDAEKFSAFFGGAPVVSVPGRLYPVEIRYRPPPQDEERDLALDVADAVDELPRDQDILVFLPGERDIRDTAEVLSGRGGANDVIPLLASLPAAEQRRAFRLSARRRIVLATNVAETSVTIPGIRCVIDSGLARISRYVHRTQVQRLQIEPVSQASARQRAGRCGRLGPGICIRLYGEDDFAARDAYTPPEVLRSSLAGVILAMLDLRLGDIERFPFLDPPKSAMIREGLRELVELGAVGHDRDGAIVLTPAGRKLARVPVEPRLARMLLAAADNACLPSVLPVVAAMSCDNPKRRPIDEKEKADQAHAAFRVEGSDFLGTLALWTRWTAQTRDLSQSKARALAKKTYLSYPKMREWRDLVRQLTDLCKRIGLSFSEAGDPEAALAREPDPRAAKRATDFAARFHKSLLAGLLARIGVFDPEEREYRGAYGLRFALHPGSVLAKRARREERRPQAAKPGVPRPPAFPAWIVAGELVDTERLFARTAAVIDPLWLESVGGDLCRYTCRAPEWDPRTGFTRGTEQVTLHGLVIVPSRRCDYARYDPAFARDVFLRRGLVDGAFPRPPPDVRGNNAVIDVLRRHAEKRRRPELFPEDALTKFFDSVLPPDINNADALRSWLRQPRPEFRLDPAQWKPPAEETSRDYPETLRIGGATLRLAYRHLPDDPDRDGIVCTVKKTDAPALRLWRADWLVRGALPEKLAWMISVLPSAQRRVLSPIDDTVAGLMLHLDPGSGPLEDAVRKTVYEQCGVRIAPDAWKNAILPNHLRMRFRILDDATGSPLADTRDLDEALRAAGVSAGASGVAAASPREAARKHVAWDFGVLPEGPAGVSADWKIRHWTALHDEGDGVTVKLYAESTDAEAAHAAGVTRLALLTLGSSARTPFRRNRCGFDVARYLESLDYADADVAMDILAGAAREAYVNDLPPVRDAETFRARLEERNPERIRLQAEITTLVTESLAAASAVSDRLEDDHLDPVTVDSVETQLAWLFFRGFPRLAPIARLRRYPQYLKGAALRLDRARNSPSSDVSKEERFAPYWEAYRERLARRGKITAHAAAYAAALARMRWALEEYRISVFAPEVRAAETVSPKRFDALLAELDAFPGA